MRTVAYLDIMKFDKSISPIIISGTIANNKNAFDAAIWSTIVRGGSGRHDFSTSLFSGLRYACVCNFVELCCAICKKNLSDSGIQSSEQQELRRRRIWRDITITSIDILDDRRRTSIIVFSPISLLSSRTV